MKTEISKENDKFIEITQKAIKKFRESLLDISNRNNLINLNFNSRSNRVLRIIDELPDTIFEKLNSNIQLKLISLPVSSSDPKDENTPEFKKCFEEEKLVNEDYLKSIEELSGTEDGEIDESEGSFQKIKRQLKDEVRKKIGLKKIFSPLTMGINDYAKACGIVPNYENPKPKIETKHEKHTDNNLQTLFYPEDLEIKARAIFNETKRFLDEKGSNTLHLSFGCLQWFETKDTPRFAPLLLLQVKLVEKKTPSGAEYSIETTEGEIFTNLSLSKKLINDFNIKLPLLNENETIEDYFKKIETEVLKNKPDWELKRFITLAIHTYSKMSMYEELDPKLWEKNGKILGAQSVIKTLFTGSSNTDHANDIFDVDDPIINAKVPILIEETDSSQFSVLVDAMNGNNLAVQGPPGTGKSTTITNLIASFLFNKKKVLFIAEKKAALDVVYKKLKDKNLGDFVFKLSSTAEKKTAVIEEIKKRLDLRAPKIDPDLKIHQKEYEEQVLKIRNYGKILDRKYFDIKKSGYEILSYLSKYKYYFDKYPEYLQNNFIISDIINLSKDEFIKNLSQIDEIKNILSKINTNFKDISKHPWFGLIEEKNNPYEIKELRENLEKLGKVSQDTDIKINKFFSSIGEKFESNSINIKKVINVFSKAIENPDHKTSEIIINFKNIKDIELLEHFLKDLKKYDEFTNIKKRISNTVELGKKYNIPNLKKHLKNIKNSIFIWSFLFNSDYRESKNYFSSISKSVSFKKNDAIKVLKDLIGFVESEIEIQSEIKKIKNNYNDLKKLLNNNFNEEKTDLKFIQEIVDNFIFGASDNQILINKNILEIKKIKKLCLEMEKTIYEFEVIYEKFSPKINQKLFFNFGDDNIRFKNIPEKIALIDLKNEELLSEYIQLNYYKTNLNQNVQTLYDNFIKEKLDFKFFDYAYKFSVYNSLAKKLFETERELSNYLSISFDNEVKKLRQLDQKIFSNKKNLLIQNLCSIDVAEGVSRGKASDLTELSLIKREVDKKRAHVPFRQLMKRAGKALRDIKPCYMLSPISLSQVVSAEPEIFDVLIIDEASQMKIEDALGSILRAKQVIIVGDPMQLPPTNFFNASSELDTEDGYVEDDESILDLSLSKFQSRMLRWHYRSKHESLIDFSNVNFYNKNLIIPPSASDKFAIKNNYLENAVYTASITKKKNDKNSIKERGGVNVIEANKISDAVVNFMKNSVKQSNKKSCLVVTMNNSQRDLIDEEIRFKSSKTPEVNAYLASWENTMEPFVVKNLENVQGDERDYIFISTLFGPNKNGIPMQRFGPINHPKGHRRLNVLFTRAKEGVELFTSLTPNQIKEGGEKGRQIFKDYLEYARMQKIERGETTGKSTDSDFEDWVKEELETLGYQVVPQVGVSGFFIDLGIKHKDFKYGYLAGIECDGAAYHSSISARDNDIVRQKVLESQGWNIYRIWSTNWFDNPRAELKKVDAYLKTLIKNQ